MSVKQQAQASEVETQEELLHSLQVDHNLLLKPTLQAVCWLIDMTLSLDTTLQVDMSMKPTFNLQAITQRYRSCSLSLMSLLNNDIRSNCLWFSICLTQMLLALVKLTVQLGLQFHMWVI